MKKITNEYGTHWVHKGHYIERNVRGMYVYYGSSRVWQADTQRGIIKCIDADHKSLAVAYP